MGRFKNNGKLSDLSAVILLFSFILIFYRYHILGQSFIPYDSKDQVYPFAVFISQTYKSGQLPLWNPYIYAGVPSFADPLYMTFYPGTLLYLLPKYLSQNYFDIVEIAHVGLGGLFLFKFLRLYRIGTFPSLFGAIVFMFGGPLVSRMQHVTQIQAITLFPMVLYFSKIGLYRRSLVSFSIAGIFQGYILMIGYQPAILSLILLVSFLVVELLSAKIKKKYFVIYLLLVLFFAIGVSSIQIIPTFEFSKFSNRPGFDYLTATRLSVPPSNLLIMLYPNVNNSLEGVYRGKVDITEGYIYIGALPVFFIVISIINWKKIGIENKFFLVSSLFFILYALGRYSPLYLILYHLLPPIKLFQRPSDALFLSQLSISVCVAFGMSNWMHEKEKSKRVYVFLIIYGIISFWVGSLLQIDSQIEFRKWYFFPNLIFLLLGFIVLILMEKIDYKKYLQVAFIIVLFCDLLTTNSNRSFNSTNLSWININQYEIYNCSEIVSLLKQDLQGLYRFEPVSAGSLWPNAGTIWRLPSSMGYSPLRIKYYENMYSPTISISGCFRNFSGFLDSYNSRLLDLLGVKFIISSCDLKEIDPNVNIERFKAVEDSCYNVYKNKSAIPLLFFVNNIVVTDQENTEKWLYNSLFSPSNTTILTVVPKGIDKEIPKDKIVSLLDIGQSNDNEIQFIRKSVNRIEIEVNSTGNGVLLFNEVFYPGWKVLINGNPAELLVTNYTFMGVYVPEGKHKIVFEFRPLSFLIGFVIHLVTQLSFLAIILFTYFTRRKDDGIPVSSNPCT